jgi:hypothetical protein
MSSVLPRFIEQRFFFLLGWKKHRASSVVVGSVGVGLGFRCVPGGSKRLRPGGVGLALRRRRLVAVGKPPSAGPAGQRVGGLLGPIPLGPIPLGPIPLGPIPLGPPRRRSRWGRSRWGRRVADPAGADPAGVQRLAASAGVLLIADRRCAADR